MYPAQKLFAVRKAISAEMQSEIYFYIFYLLNSIIIVF